MDDTRVQTPDIIAKDILVAYLSNHGVSGSNFEEIANKICLMYDKIHKQVIKSQKENNN